MKMFLRRGLFLFFLSFFAFPYLGTIDAHEEETSETRIIYSCPMHPHIAFEESRRCPECGMTLTTVKAHADHDSRYGGQLVMTGDWHIEFVETSGKFYFYISDAFRTPFKVETILASMVLEGEKGKSEVFSLVREA